jgi:eukaryotic-like serine/threonine-protein kinase
MIGQTVSHYRILEKLGEGGMGVVYKAEDAQLHRQVALKFLPKAMTADPEARVRFEREAQAAAALNHPNIITVYEIGEHEGQVFIAMEYVEGQTLKDMISVGGSFESPSSLAPSPPLTHHPLPIDQVIAIATQIAEGLSAAHAKGIVHRDIKPQNILVDKNNRVKILDFGLAKLKGVSSLTKESSTLGTVHYMSPEQAMGKEIDQSTDIWSLGVVLYEMLTGELPFKGEYEAALFYSIVHEKPQELALLRPDAPAPLSPIIYKVLQKDRTLRYQTTNELIIDLRKLSVPNNQLPRQEKSIAVLPFENLSPDPDQEYFSDGLTEEVISDLSNVNALRVISRSSAMTFKGTKKKVPEIARELDVQYVLEGSVRKAGNSLRITAQLIDAANDAHLWAEKYSGTLDDVFDVQEKVSRSIVAALKLKLTPEESKKIAERPIDNVAAYQCYLKANAEIMKFTERSLDSARVHLQKGLDILGDNALLYSTMAFVYWQYVNIGVGQEEYIAKAEEYAQKALALDPESPQVHFIIGMLSGWVYGNVRENIRQLKMALAVNPNYVDALILLAGLSTMSFGKLGAAIPLVQKVRQIDPLDPWNYWLQGRLFYFNGQYKLAAEQLRQIYQADPENHIFRLFYAWTLTYTGQIDEAFSIIDHSAKTAPNSVFTKFGLLLKYGLLKERERAFREMTIDFEKTCKRDHQWSYLVAVPLALVDARKESLDWLENAVNKGFINYPELERDPYLANIRGEERFKKLLERVKYEWEHFEVWW